MPLANLRDVWTEFRDTKCHVCGARKYNATGFCRACYFALPHAMRGALWQRFGEGFEQVYTDAKDWLVQRRVAADA